MILVLRENKEMQKKSRKEKRKTRVRAKIKGTAARPRLSVFRSNKAVYAQLINDEGGKTLVSANEKEISPKTKQQADKRTKIERARLVGEILAKKAIKKKVKKVIFDRGPYRYHGRVKALAEGAKKGGLLF